MRRRFCKSPNPYGYFFSDFEVAGFTHHALGTVFVLENSSPGAIAVLVKSPG